MAQRRVYRGKSIELVFGAGLLNKPLSALELMGYAKSGPRRELLSCGSVPPDTVKKLPVHELWRYRNRGELPTCIAEALKRYDRERRTFCFDAALAYVWTYHGERPDFDEGAMTYLSGTFSLLPGTRVVANEAGLSWVDPVAVNTAIFIAYRIIQRFGLSRTWRDRRVGSGSNPSIN